MSFLRSDVDPAVDDGHTGTATTYDLRFSLSPIDANTWGAATRVSGEPLPSPAGQPESFTVDSLDPGTTYYFALKVADEASNWSALSNLASASTTPSENPLGGRLRELVGRQLHRCRPERDPIDCRDELGRSRHHEHAIRGSRIHAS